MRPLTGRGLTRAARRALYRHLARDWTGTRDALRRAIRGGLKRFRGRPGFFVRLVREARFAALVGAAVLMGAASESVFSAGSSTNIHAVHEDDRIGESISDASDVNGDGLADAIAGASGVVQSWKVIADGSNVVFGQGTPTADVELSAVAAGTGGFVINGIDSNDYSGLSVASAGDVNGDGLADLIVGAFQADPGGDTEAGESYVVFGKAGGTAVDLSDVAGGTGGFAINGIDADDFSGASVSSAGDVNGDGLADLIVGAFRADPGGDSGAGESYVVFGKTDGTVVELSAVAAGTGGFVINGIDADDFSGVSVASAGDVNGDGLADLIVGASNADPGGDSGAGESYVVFGKTDGTAVELSAVAAGTGGFVINGIDADDFSGVSVASAGDVNGDGLSDLIVGAFRADPGGDLSAGESYVVFGKANGTAVELSAVAGGTGGFVINGIDADDFSGASVASAGDVNGDCLADLIVGAYGADPGGATDAGESYVVFGKPDGTAVELSAVAGGTGGFVINGIDSSDRSGISVASAGDVNGDGLSDLIVGAYRADPGGATDAGESYVVFGKADGVAVELSAVAGGTGGFAINGIDTNDYSGGSVASAGDVNGDGLSDLIVGARFADPRGDSAAGESYVVFSPVAPAASGQYKRKTLGGDGAGGFVAPVADFGDVARARIDFSDDDTGSGGGLNNASTETVTITRSGAGITNLSDAANVLWQITSDRAGFDSARVTLKYLDSEIAGLPVTATAFSIYTAPAASGPWTELETTRSPERNELSAAVTGFSFFAIAPASDAIFVQLADVAAGMGGFVINGIDADDYSGLSVASAGDVNGDGLADLIVGAYMADPGGDPDAGESYVVFGKPGGTAVELSAVAAGTGGFVINGIDAVDLCGVSVASAGDVNGDGLSDLIVGAKGGDPGRAEAGESYVVFGKANGTAVELSAVAGGTGGFVINGIVVDDFSGSSVSSAGDVNGDGLSDLIVGASRGDPGGNRDAGESYVVFGKPDGTAVELSAVAAGTGGFAINGIDVDDFSGFSVASAGDVNGDGLSDLIVGAWGGDPSGGPEAGESYVVFGKRDGTAVELSNVAGGAGGFVINGIDRYDQSGRSVASAGDVNGDGLADLIVGAFYASPGGDGRAGESYVVFGKPDGTAVELSAVAGGTGGFVINGIDAYDVSGWSVSSAGDVNGDGLSDLIVGAYQADPGGDTDAGESYVVFGKADGVAVELSAVAGGTGGFVINGIDADDFSGGSVASAGDVNGDGLSDLIVGARSANPAGDSRAGESYVVFSPIAPATSGQYKRKTLAGDGAGGFVAPVADFGDVARARIDFSDDDTGSGGGLNNASTETVTITRSGAGITNLSDAANVLWQISSDRAGFDSARVTLKYLDSEIAGLPVTATALSIYAAPAASGPWTELDTMRHPERNELSATVTGFSFFAIAPASDALFVQLADVAAGMGGFVINGIDADDLSGRGVSSAGDVNGDGLADLIVGAFQADPGGDTEAGESYVVFGKAGGTAVELSDVAAGTGGFAINGIDADDYSGFSVASAGDINGDGFSDLIVGAWGGDPEGGPEAGESYVVFGKADGTAVELSAVAGGTGGFVINGIDANDFSGTSVASAGDVNGDGLSDLIVGAFQADPGGDSGAGESYVVFGKTDGTAVELFEVAAGTGGFAINGIDVDDFSGLSVASAGDVNGDGLSDLIVGASRGDPGGDSYAGESYVVFGKANGTAVELSAVAGGTGGFVINGIDVEDFSGISVSSAGDVNGDGLADLIVGARGGDPGGNSYAGESYVVFGKPDGTAVELSAVAGGTGGFVINGIDADDFSGASVASAGDVNGDGFSDLIVGAYLADPGGDSYAGESYVVFGKPDGAAVELSAVAGGAGGFVINGIDSSDLSGRSVASAGDVNGDGLSDLIIGASEADPRGDSAAGESYVVFSPVAPAASGQYKRKTLAGDGAGGFVAPVADFGDVARARIDFSDDDTGSGGGLNGASSETVTITRSGAGITNLSDAAGVLWQIISDRAGFDSARVTLKYLDSEIAGLPVPAGALSIYAAPAASGPWTELDTTRSPERNELSAAVTGFSFFAIAPASDALFVQLADVAAGMGGFVINGIDANDRSGRSVASAGDVNGDGLADLIVGAPEADPGGDPKAGESYVVFGKANGTAVELSDVAAGTGGFAINGIDAYDFSGTSVASAGDVNGDGLADLIVGAFQADPGGDSDAGESYVVFGKTDGTVVELSAVAAGTGGFVINGIDADDFSGVSVASAGDVNGDGFSDLIVGAYVADPGGDTDAGESYLVFGKPDGAAVELADVAGGTGGFTINGIDTNDYSGGSVASAGDVNGDGLSDLIVGARGGDPGGNSYAGESYVVFGKTDGTAVELSDVAAGTGGFAINGIDADDFSGVSVASAGDVNGDGLSDLIVGAFYASPGGDSRAGESYVVFGKANGTAVELSDVAAGTGGFVINGIDVDDFSGVSVASAGDVNGDGLSDLIVGARGGDPGGDSAAGESYVVFGKANGTAVELSGVAAGTGGFAINGIDGYDYSGISVASAGDVNGDGLSDLIVGAYPADPGGDSSAGESYVVFSPVAPAASGQYKRKTLAGDGAGGFVAPVADFGDVARARIDFSDDDTGSGGGLNNASTETVTITRSGAGITNLADAADVVWQIMSDRASFSSARVTLKYLDSEIAGLPGGDSELTIYRSDSASGPWTALDTTRTPERNELSATVTGFSFFAIGPATPSEQDIDVQPGSVDFGAQTLDLGATAGTEVVIANAGQLDLNFTGAQAALSGPGAAQFAITADTMETVLGGGEMRKVTVAFDPSTAGAASASLVVTSDDPDEPTVNVPLMGVGVESGLSASTLLLDLGARNVDDGPTAGIALTITNTSASTITLAAEGVAVAGADAAQYAIMADSGETSLGQGASRMLTIAFDPSSPGAKTASLQVTRQGAVTPALAIALVASGSKGSIADLSADTILRYILGVDSDPAGLDVNNDGTVDLADVLTNQSTHAPPLPDSPMPATGATNVSLSPGFSWTDPGATSVSFDFEIFNAQGFSMTLKGLTSPAVSLASPLAAGTTYQWRVTSQTPGGASVGPTWTFTTEP